MITNAKANRPARDHYLELVKKFPLRPIRGESEHDRAIAVLRKLVGREDLDAGGRDYADALTVLVKDYEDRHHQLELSRRSPVEVLRHLMDESGMNVTDLGRIIGSQPAASLLLSGKREFSKAHIRRLADHFRINPGLFL